MSSQLSEESAVPDIPVMDEDEYVLYGCPLSYSRTQKVIHPSLDLWFETANTMLNDGWNMCVDLTAVDYSQNMNRDLPTGIDPQRYEVVASFISHVRKDRLRLRVQVSESTMKIDSIYQLYPGVDFLEREVYDMFGIEFVGHPDLTRILMPEEWKGHPLRKDYAIGSIPVEFKYPQGGYDE